MTGLFSKLSARWNNALEKAEEETRMTQQERDVAEEDFEARKDDVAADRSFQLGVADYERDSEQPGHPRDR